MKDLYIIANWAAKAFISGFFGAMGALMFINADKIINWITG